MSQSKSSAGRSGISDFVRVDQIIKDARAGTTRADAEAAAAQLRATVQNAPVITNDDPAEEAALREEVQRAIEGGET